MPSPNMWSRCRLYFFEIHPYNNFTYRIHISVSKRQLLPKKLPDWTLANRLPSRIELPFVNADIDQIVSPDLVSFVESVFNEKDAHPWPLFASDLGFPEYAWSIAGEAEYQRRRKGTPNLMRGICSRW